MFSTSHCGVLGIYLRLPYDIRQTVMKMSTILVLHCSSFVYTKANDVSLVDSSLCTILNICYFVCFSRACHVYVMVCMKP